MLRQSGESELNGIYTIVLFSLAAIAALAVVMHRTGKSTKASFSRVSEAESLIREQLPDLAIRDVELLNSGNQALARVSGASTLILLRALGSRWVVRTINEGDVREVTVRERLITVRFSDFADPAASLLFESDASVTAWATLLTELRGGSGTAGSSA